MAKPALSRETLLPMLAAHVMEHGLGTASLRPLAKAAGTSDRMLIYHFGSKEGLIDALLRHLAGGFVAGLEAALPPGALRGAQEHGAFGTVEVDLRIAGQTVLLDVATARRETYPQPGENPKVVPGELAVCVVKSWGRVRW